MCCCDKNISYICNGLSSLYILIEVFCSIFPSKSGKFQVERDRQVAHNLICRDIYVSSSGVGYCLSFHGLTRAFSEIAIDSTLLCFYKYYLWSWDSLYVIMKKGFINLVIFAAICGMLYSCQSPFGIEEQRIKTQMNDIDILFSQYLKLPSYNNTAAVIQAVQNINIEISEDEIKSQKDKLHYAELNKTINEKRNLILNSINEKINEIGIPVLSVNDNLMEVGSSTVAMRLKKGDLLKFQFSGESAVNLTIYNINSKQSVKHIYNKISFQDSLLIQNSAIYLLEIVNKHRPQYVSQSINIYRSSVEQFLESHSVCEKIVSANKQDFMAFPKNEYELTNLFEEPRKITLRGSWKAAWSGHKRTVIALNIPQNTIDVAYQLRIDTSEGTNYNDGNFYNSLSTQCSKLEIFGITVKEKNESHSSILREVLQKMETPRRAEEAYCSMYVFYNAKDAQNFVSKKGGEVVNYDIDYSLIGTQSCNGRFPVKDKKNVYIGFENDQFSGSVYLWMEAVATSTATNYYTTIYN